VASVMRLRQLAEAPCDDTGIQGFIGPRSEYTRKRSPGWIRPSKTLASVMVSGPPRR